jgi:hypothetical protein
MCHVSFGLTNFGILLSPWFAGFDLSCCVNSQTSFIIFVMGMPVIWTSRLQADIATSTMESEYNAMFMAIRDVIPLRSWLTKNIIQGLGGNDVKIAHIKTTVHEDNHGALHLGTMEPGQMTPWSKHYGIKYHWFQSKLKPNKTEMMAPVASAMQHANFLMKSLWVMMFKANRKLTLGWWILKLIYLHSRGSANIAIHWYPVADSDSSDDAGVYNIEYRLDIFVSNSILLYSY